ncbi:hypothetical protein BSZ39_11125 [Bowdeniella nasicola]|uniref:DUF3817 domain-containing protein n=1 Tax=Bowdeniella nasicola TaxID=208480 RepID=A0A1Q5PZR9_9ACTO|nr:DUF3817 domain-containing protein [Bowdeniella nasicola]OKL53128.1 hypothetical protein BSZ39_11125 [Bowdeniella nasicola]
MTSVESKARTAFSRYRIMAFITGTLLLLLTLEIVLKYVLQLNGLEDPNSTWSARPVIGNWIAIVHGWVYVIYLITVFGLWSQMRWGFGRMIALIVAGVIPVMSFILEPTAKKWVEADLPELVAKEKELR